MSNLQSEFAKLFVLVANMRDDVNDQFGEHMTYRITPAAIIPFTETKLKASYGTGFKAPLRDGGVRSGRSGATITPPFRFCSNATAPLSTVRSSGKSWIPS